MARILVADDEPGLREFIVDSLELDDHTVVPAKDGREAAKLLDERGFDLVLTDLKMPGLDGMGLLRKVRAEQPEVEVIMMTAHGTVDNAVEAMKLGAFEYLQKPLSGPDELRLLVGRALERRGLRDRVDGAERHTELSGPPLTYGDPAMRPVVEAIEKVARTSATVRAQLDRPLGAVDAILEAATLDGTGDEEPQLVGARDRFLQVLERAELHRLDRVFHRAVRRHHDDLDLGLLGADLAQQPHAVEAGHLEIGEHQIEAAFVEDLRCFFSVLRGDHRVLVELERIGDELAQAGFVIGDQDACHGDRSMPYAVGCDSRRVTAPGLCG